MEKKRLKLMPEVLPAPTSAAPSPREGEPRETPRSRTRDHMQRLLAAAALSGTVACTKAGDTTTQGYGVVDPMPVPSSMPVPTVDAAVAPRDAAAEAAAHDAATSPKDAASDAPKKPRPPPPHHPFPVVDPIPRPAGKHGGGQ